MNEDVFIGLGSNLQEPVRQVQIAFDELEQIAQTCCIAQSALYRSAPVGPGKQPDYINAAAHLRTSLPPLALLDALQSIEHKHQRVRQIHWGPRTLDLDILLFGNRQINTERLTTPHPYLHERLFVLQPLHDIAPELVIPGHGALAQLLRDCADHPTAKI